MESTFRAFIDFEPSALIASPPPILYGQPGPTNKELDQLTFGTLHQGPLPTGQYGSQTPRTPREVEARSFQAPEISIDMVQSLSSPPRNKQRFLSACLVSLAMGLNDSAPGALIPYVESHYGISYGTVSLIFVANALGFVSAAPFTNGLHARLGRSKLLSMSMLLMTLAYIIIVSTPPFPAVVVSFFFAGLGMAMALAMNNSFTASLANASTLLGIFHGAYGVGGILGPLVATALVSKGARWSAYYGLTLGLSVVNCVFAFVTYRDYEAETAVPLLSALQQRASRTINSLEEVTIQRTPANGERANGSERSSKFSFFKTLKSRSTLLGALFIFAYQGAEVSISGWVLSFLLATRPHPPSQSSSLGYVTSGFWAGITLGRFVLSHPAHRLGEKAAVFSLIAGAAGFQILVWFVPNIIGEAVAVAVVGLLLGPIYPAATVVFSRLLPMSDLVPSLAVISAMGSSGGAVAPFVTGIISQKVGTWVLNPVAVGLFACMGICWAGLPKIVKRRE